MRKNNSNLDLQNAEQQKAFELVANTNTSLFITGKAGTGKLHSSSVSWKK